jgi:hypothetical protein
MVKKADANQTHCGTIRIAKSNVFFLHGRKGRNYKQVPN